MNLQERLIEVSTQLRSRAATLATAALDSARARAGQATKRVEGLTDSIATLSVAGRALNEVAQRHAARFVKQNSALATAAGKDLGALARSTYATLAGRKPAPKTRKPPAARRRASAKSA